MPSGNSYPFVIVTDRIPYTNSKSKYYMSTFRTASLLVLRQALFLPNIPIVRFVDEFIQGATD